MLKFYHGKGIILPSLADTPNEVTGESNIAS
jgi:hypothetical protein